MSELVRSVKRVRPEKNGEKGITYKLILPKKWIEEQGLGKGGFLVVKEKDNSLILEKMK